MTREEKKQLVSGLVDTLEAYPNFYIADTGGMTVAEVNDLRRACHKAEVKMQVVKNTLVRKALDSMEADYSEAYEALKQTTALFFASEENPNVPAKVLKDYRGKDKEIPLLKAAVIDTAVYLGDDKLEQLANLKSKGELIGEVVTLLQSPAKNVLGALQSGGNTLSGLVKALQERAEAA